MVEIGWEQRIYPAAKIAIVVDALAAEGVPVAEALRRTSLSPSDLRSSTTQVSVNQVIESYRNAVRLSRAPHFAFKTGLRTHVSHYGMYGFAILSSMNYRETMHFAVKYHQLATPVVKLQFREEAGRVDWTIDPLPHPAIDARLYRFIVETQLGILVSLHRDIMGSAFNPLALEVTFAAPESEEQYWTTVRCPVSFRQPRNRFLFDTDWLNGAPQFGNEITYASVLALCDDLHDRLQNRIGVAGKVRAYLLATLGRRTSLDHVAAHLGVPVRTLRRKLRDEETSFRDLFDQLRGEVPSRLCFVTISFSRFPDHGVRSPSAKLGFLSAITGEKSVDEANPARRDLRGRDHRRCRCRSFRPPKDCIREPDCQRVTVRRRCLSSTFV